MKEQQLPAWMRARIQPRPAPVELPLGQGATWINYGPQYSEYKVLSFPLNGGEETGDMSLDMTIAAEEGFEFLSSNHYYELSGKRNYIVVIMGKPVMPPELDRLAAELRAQGHPQS